jgi:hypothetical protein
MIEHKMIVLDRAPQKRCPICRQVLAFSRFGFKQHLRKHVRQGDINQSDVHGLCDKFIGPFRERF